jgi:hypothetical protein
MFGETERESLSIREVREVTQRNDTSALRLCIIWIPACAGMMGDSILSSFPRSLSLARSGSGNPGYKQTFTENFLRLTVSIMVL